MKRIAIVAVALLAVICTVSNVAAQDHKWKVLAAVSYLSPLSDSTDSAGDVLEAASAVGWEVGAEWRLAKLVGLELDYMQSTNDIEFNGVVLTEVDVNPLTFAANFHIIPDNVIDFYVGPVASYVSFDADDADIDSEATFGAAAGLDIGIGEHFAVTGGARWLDLSAEDEDGTELSIDPIFLRVGVAWRF